ncbi:Uncharacterized protein PRO82_002292 [Candidatus Protochlamydia amoebophila]|uniref:CHAT domain-containing tetratricopeptide repeat protein n=1 Tax=Candidatus Protochlamydia amoebophila TaxID=362787 RepID=UPI001BCA5907|nr:CHAT domain-containing tetratricopeptide repeat protein [Candidatus Protochlamydia amoebophila]MBS4164950.1 Uncharacterized protein [Candidatus Protochlamydia amoebophila]
MHVDSVKFSDPYYLHYPLLPTISPLDHVKGLIESYKTKSNSEENIILTAKLVIEKVNQLTDIAVQRECLCRLLVLEIEELQHLIKQELASLLNFATIYEDIQHDRAQHLIQLEAIISEIVEVKLESNELNFIHNICMIYQEILEHLWLLPYLEYGNHCSNLLAKNKDSILSNMRRWKKRLYQLANEKRIEKFIPKNIENSIQRIFVTLPKEVIEKINRQKVTNNKNEELLEILRIVVNIYRGQNDFHRAIFHTEEILKLLKHTCEKKFHQEGLLTAIMHTHRTLLNWYLILCDYEKAIYHGESALVFYRKAQAATQIPTEINSNILIELGKAYFSINKNKDAIRCYQDALKLIKNKFTQAGIYMEIGRAHANDQCYQLDKEAYQKALHLYPQDDVLLIIKIHENFASFFKDSSQYEAAIFHAEKISELIQHPLVQEDLESIFNALTNLGNIYGNMGVYDKELDHYEQALKRAEKASDFPKFLPIVYQNLGDAYHHLENHNKAIEYYVKALERINKPLDRARCLLDLGHAFYGCNKFSEAIEKFEEANSNSNNDLVIKLRSFNALGLCYGGLGNEEKAIQSFKESIHLSQLLKDHRYEAISFHNLGDLYYRTNPRLAEESYRRSINVYAALHQDLKDHSQWQINFFEEQSKPLLKLEILLLKNGKTKKGLQITDFRRSRALISSLTKKFPSQKNDSLFSSGLNSQEIQAFACKMNTCFILYSLCFKSADSIIVWVIPPQGEIICQQLPLGSLPDEVKEAPYIFKTFPFITEPMTAKRRPFLRPQKNRGSDTYIFLDELNRGGESESISSAVVESFKKRLSLWYEALIAPIEALLPTDPQQVVTIIPDGFLSQIPFAAFLDKEGTYLIEKHPLSIAPSIGILNLLDKIPKESSESSLVIGNPTGPHLKDTLPLAEKEAQTIVAPLLKTTPERTLLRESATAQGVLEGMVDARWIHLACHGSTELNPEGKFGPHSVFEGLFKLAPERENPNGYLHAQEIASLTLRTELVFMSACFSGRGKLHGEGSVGPVWSFLATGALSTVATYWRLPDSDLTLQMVETFYRHLLGMGLEKLNKAQALQKAMLMAIRQEREQPHLWGAFFLSGLIE